LGVELGDEQGVEAFYNMAVTPWFLLTADLQGVDPVVSNASTAVTGSLRAQDHVLGANSDLEDK
jgi:porin